MIDTAGRADAAGMAMVLGTWIKQTPWMPDLHLPVEHIWFCEGLTDTCAVWVLRQDVVTGFIARRGDEVIALYLAPVARGQGHGKALLTLAKAGQDRLTLWTFQANTRAVAFYQREGFAGDLRTDGAGNDENLPDLRMVWTRGLT